MPIIQPSNIFAPPPLHFNGHFQSIVPSIFRKIEGVNYQRERLILPDSDFVDLDWVKNNQENLVVLTHGLEGDTARHYMKGTAKLFSENGYDVLAWNCRSCSGEMNKALRLYNHGEIGDIGQVIGHALTKKNYKKVVLVGFSMGGNITLKYLGVNGSQVPRQIVAGVAISAPTDLKSSAKLLDNPSNLFYKKRFMGKLFKKIQQKAVLFPDKIDLSLYKKVKLWQDFDEFYSAPMNGYTSANDFYEQASAANYVANTAVPVLIYNAKNDPLLTPDCAAEHIARQHPFLFSESPNKGGHVGFVTPNDEFSWAERRALSFVTDLI